MSEKPLTNFTLAEATEICGLSSAMVAYLVRHEIVKPSASKYRRRGKRLLFSFQDLIGLRAIRSLLEKGISPLRLTAEIRRFRRDLKRIDSTQLSADLRYLVTDGKRLFFWNRAKHENPLAVSGQLAFAFMVDLGPIHAETRELGIRVKQQR